MSDRQIVCVEWIDSARHGTDWLHRDDVLGRGACICSSVGWVLEETEDHILLAPHLNSEQQTLGSLSIPLCAIINCESLGGGK